MRHYIEIKVPETIRKHLQYVECDLCKRQHTNEWKSDSYDQIDIDINMRTGWSCPDGGSGENTSFDICPECFKNKLIPWMKSQGAEPTVEEWDW